MLLVKEGQLRKAGLLYDKYHVAIYNYFMRRCRMVAEAEDMMHTVFERMIKYRNSYTEGKSVKTWLFTIARNVWYDNLKKVRHEDLEPSINHSTLAVSQNEKARDEQEVLHMALDIMSHEEGEIIRLAKMEHFKYQEIAAMLHISEANVKVKVHRAMKNLKNVLINQLDYEY